MKKLVAGVLYAFCMLTAVHSGDISAQNGQGTLVSTTAQEGGTGNLITSGTNHTWSGVTTGSIPSGCATAGPCPGGPTPLYDPATNTVNFSYNANATVAQTIAINNALAGVGAGVKITGYNYSYDIRNMNGDNRQGGTDTINVYQSLIGTNGATLLSSQQNYNTKFEWTSVGGTQNAGTPIEQAAASYLKFSMTGGDNGYWGGYFGPQVRNVNMSLNYGAAPIKTYTMPDDGWVNVPLQFGFPFYGKVFTNSFMFDNGVVGFFDPVAGGCNPANGYCGGQQWNAQPFSNNMSNQFSYMIAPAWADLAPNANTKYHTQGDASFQKYTWENIGQYYDQSKLQTFDLTIKPSGFIGVNYGNINLNQTNLGIGTIGNPALGEYNQIGFHNAGTNITTGSVANWTMNNTPDACSANPTSSPSCPGYETAMCTSNPLYSPSCPGYQTALLTQQCSANPLYSQQCPGYAAAYLDLQCSSNPLYSTTCQGYQQATNECTANPLSHSYCPAYQTATTQCSTNPLYGSFCPGYATADTECTANPLSHTYCTNYQLASTGCSSNPLYGSYCPGYQTSLNACSTNPLSNTMCTGYTTASTQCTANSLYASYCSGYQTTLNACSTNPLSNTLCPSYTNATNQCTINSLYANYCPGYQTALTTCSTDPLSNNMCTGYTTASTECSLNQLSHSYCPSYQSAQNTCSTNPLSNPLCTGYQTASTSCSSNPLYANYCTGYQTAIETCASNPLSNTMCSNYQTATTSCAADPLSARYCPGYQFAYDCSLDGLFSKQCPNYSTAYAKKMLFEQQGLASTIATAGTVATVAAVAAADPANQTSTATAVSSDANVAAAVTVKTPSAASSETSPAAAVKLTAPPPAPAMQMAQAEPKKNDGPGEKKEEKKEEGAKKNDNGPSSAGPSGDSKPSDQPKSNREALQERRREAAQKEAVAKGKDLANEMGKASDMEAQKAVQNVVIQAMGFTPGFDTYNKAMLPDTRFYKPYQVYGGQVNVDNRNVSRRLMGGSDRTHQEMVDSQYNRGN